MLLQPQEKLRQEAVMTEWPNISLTAQGIFFTTKLVL
jgi:hypothetical protein